MLAMQYGFDLPDDFDLDSVRKRIAEIGPRFNALPGLYMKAFLVAGRTGATPNRYAPFYLWNDPAGMTSFLMSDSFRAVEAKYGRPEVKSWSPIAHEHGSARAITPTFAAERNAARLTAGEFGLHSVFAGLDARKWQLNRTALWADEPKHIADARTFELRYLATSGGR